MSGPFLDKTNADGTSGTGCPHAEQPASAGYAPPPPPGYGPQYAGYDGQQQGYQQGPYGPPMVRVPDYLVWSILTLFCCQPLGIAAIVFSALTIGDKNGGRIDSAVKNSQWAKTMVMIGLGIGIAFWVIYIGCIIAVGVVGALNGNM